MRPSPAQNKFLPGVAAGGLAFRTKVRNLTLYAIEIPHFARDDNRGLLLPYPGEWQRGESQGCWEKHR